MKPSERRKAMKAEMAQRAQEAYNNKDDSGKFKPYLVRGRLGKVQMWKCSEDEHFLNFIPFVAGEHNPNVAPGKMAYALDVFVHRKVGVNEDSYLCMSRTYGKPCSICEHQAEVRKQDEYDDKFAKSLNPTRRVIYNIECLDSEKQTQMGIQIFDVSHYLFEKELAELAKKPRGGGYVLFSDPDEGKTVFFRKSGSGATNTEYKAFAFEDRDEPISDELLDSAVCLDSLLYIPTYEEVYAAFHGTVEEEPTEEKEFECPDNYGEMDACDACPDADSCADELGEGEEGEEEGGAEGEEEDDLPPAEPEVTKPRVSRRAAAKQETVAAEKPAEKPAVDPAATAGRRVRRRPGA